MISSLASAAQFRGKSSYQIEAALKKQTADLLKTEEKRMWQAYALHALQKSLWKSFSEDPGHIVSLNFDRLLITASSHKPKKIKSPGSQNLAKSFPSSRKADLTYLFVRESVQSPENHKNPTQVWFPHGSVVNKDTLRLGMRDYGFQPNTYHHAFQTFKAWERKVTGRPKGSPLGSAHYQKLLTELHSMDCASHARGSATGSADHWVTRFMLLPLTIIGAGIGMAESGLHWLLIQRERNLAKVPAKDRPPLRFFSDLPSANCFLDPHRIDPAGNWDRAWDKALND